MAKKKSMHLMIAVVEKEILQTVHFKFGNIYFFARDE